MRLGVERGTQNSLSIWLIATVTLTSTIPMATRSLSSVVSNLVRAQMGASVPTALPDDDLDQHVAQLILKEARQKEARYKGGDGIRAYLSYVAGTHTLPTCNAVPRV